MELSSSLVYFPQQQYEFVYTTVAMHIQCGVTVIKYQQLLNIVQDLARKDPQTRSTGFEQQFKVGPVLLHVQLQQLTCFVQVHVVHSLPAVCITRRAVVFGLSVDAAGDCAEAVGGGVRGRTSGREPTQEP